MTNIVVPSLLEAEAKAKRSLLNVHYGTHVAPTVSKQRQNPFAITHNQQTCLDSFERFTYSGYFGYCAACLLMLYREDVLRRIYTRQYAEMTCIKWNLDLVVNKDGGLMVCKKHTTAVAIKKVVSTLVYPGQQFQDKLAYREKGALSLIKTMASITRSSTVSDSYVGFHQLSKRLTVYRSRSGICSDGVLWNIRAAISVSIKKPRLEKSPKRVSQVGENKQCIAQV